eukprot:02917_4
MSIFESYCDEDKSARIKCLHIARKDCLHPAFHWFADCSCLRAHPITGSPPKRTRETSVSVQRAFRDIPETHLRTQSLPLTTS